MNVDFYNTINRITEEDKRYHADAYEFVMRSLWFTQQRLKRQDHVNGRELLEGIREYAIEQYGPMSKTVVRHWGVHTTGDFGEIVFNMIKAGIMRKDEKDSISDFKDVYDFEEAFDVFKIDRFKK